MNTKISILHLFVFVLHKLVYKTVIRITPKEE